VFNMKYVLTIIIVLFVSTSGQSELEKRMKELKRKTQNEMHKQRKEVQDYISKQDSLFTEFLKKEWELYKGKTSPTNFKNPKPKEPPAVKPKKKESPEEEEQITLPEPKETTPQEKIAPKKSSPQGYTQKARIDFFGNKIVLHYSNNFVPGLQAPYNNKKLGRIWEKLAQTNYKNFVEQLKTQKRQIKLNGWGIYSLIKTIGDNLAKNQQNSVIFSWFFLNKLGYKTKIGREDNKLYLLMPSNTMLYSRSYITVNSSKYFVLNAKDENQLQIKTYDSNYPGASQNLTLKLNQIPDFTHNSQKKSIEFQYKSKTYHISINLNSNLIQYFSKYPQTEYQIYLNSPMSPEMKSNLVNSLRPYIQDRTRAQAVNFLLSFTQKAFKYKRDHDQFGYEKSMFPEETLYYKYSDCEDRSALFSYLIRKLLGLEIIGLKYPGHLATAVNLDNIKGDKINWEGKDYIICDPTYINSKIGQSLPKFKNSSPEIIVP